MRLLTKQAERAALAAGWVYKLWSDADLLTLPEYAALRSLGRTFVHLANIGRYAILNREGGLYVDADTAVARMPDDAGPNGPLVGAWVVEGADLDAVMAAPPGHAYFRRLLDAAASPASYEHDRMGLCAAMLGSDVHRWPARYWVGGWRWRYGNHLGQHLEMGSNIPLGDTFPPGATI